MALLNLGTMGRPECWGPRERRVPRATEIQTNEVLGNLSKHCHCGLGLNEKNKKWLGGADL